MMTDLSSLSLALSQPPVDDGAFAWVRTWFAGGPAHGDNAHRQAGGTTEIAGHRYRFFSGPYAQLGEGREPYQVFVSAELDAEAAQVAVQHFLAEPRDLTGRGTH